MIVITLPDGTVKSYPKYTTPYDISKSISLSLASKVISASLDGRQIEVMTPLLVGGHLIMHTWEASEGKKAFWHSTAHLLAQAVEMLYPGVKPTIGPPIKRGFYYDFDFGKHKISDKELPKIEAKMYEIARGKHPFSLKGVSKTDAIKHYKALNNQYKVELIEDLKDGEITFCNHDTFTDLCRGGHIPITSLIKAIKLTGIAGAYWRGDENRTQLTRIYGISFPKKKYLDEYLQLLEEAGKRDHRKIGKELGIFTFSKAVGQGLPLWLPTGSEIRLKLESFLRSAQKSAGYESVVTPHIGEKQLYVTSGHYEKYGEDSFQPIKTPNEDESFFLKPMNCPHHCEIYKSTPFSYRDLPKRFAEFGTVYRYEQSGELHGLTRVRCFTQDDAHIFCTNDQLESEFVKVIKLVLYVFDSFGFKGYKVQVSLRDRKTPKKYIGTEENWEKAEMAILSAVKSEKMDYTVEEGEAAFYGPKLDFMIEDALGREWQLGTIQVDYNLPERFDLSYIGIDNKPHRPVMIHRAPFGSLERFMALLLEHSGGFLPIWLTPIQVILLTITEKVEKYAQNVSNLLKKYDIRTEIDSRNETIGKKIREAEMKKIPYMLIIGNEELKNETINIRKHGGDNLGGMKVEILAKMVNTEVQNSVKPFEY